MMLPKIVYFVPTRASSFSITFDDGPTPGVTDRLLEVLATKGAKATFFMVGEAVQKNPGLAKAVSDAGHAVGVHSHRHRRGMKDWPARDVLDDFSRAKDVIQSAIGKDVGLIRPPFGNVCQSIMDACIQLDLTYVGWSLNSKDWLGGSAGRLLLFDRGSIIVFHDGGRVDTKKVTKTIPLIEYLLGNFRGLSSVTVSDLLGLWHEDLVIKDENGLRKLGLDAMVEEHQVNGIVHVYWHPEDLLAGISYGFDFGGERLFVDIPPMSNVDEWIKPVVSGARRNPDGATVLGKAWSSRYNGS